MADSGSILKLFGYELRRQPIPELPTFTPAITDDGAVTVAAGGSYGQYVDMDGSVRSEAELINKYRQMAEHPEVETAIDDIVNEAIIQEDQAPTVKINLEKLTELPKNLKTAIEAEFLEAQRLLDFNNHAYEEFKRWYIDGRLYFHAMIDPKMPQAGIQELRYIDPKKLRKIREVKKKRDLATNTIIQGDATEYYLYNDKGFNSATFGSVASGTSSGLSSGLRIAKDSIVHTTSGLTSVKGDMVLSYLHKAIKPLNMLRSMEDSLVIYRISRAPERRIFYIDVGNLPKLKAEQYLRDMMAKFKNKIVYDSTTGEVRDDRKFMCLDMETKIPLLDGRTLTISEIEKEYKTKELWAYSCNPETGEFAPGLISWAGVTNESAKVMKITLDNGKEIIATPDHKFPVWGKGFVKAEELVVGESMIPLYRQNNKISPKSKEYEQIYDNVNKNWEFTHRLVQNWKNKHKINEIMIHNPIYVNQEKQIIHHVDFNRFNNSPNNLVKMNNKDHIEYHSSVAKETNKIHWNNERKENLIKSQSIEYSERLINRIIIMLMIKNLSQKDILNELNSDEEIIKEFYKLNCNKNIKLKNLSNITQKDLNRIAKKLEFKSWVDFRKYYNPSNSILNRKLRNVRGSKEHRELISISRRDKPTFTKIWKITTPTNESLIVNNLNEYCRNNGLNRNNIKRSYGSKKFFAEQLHNHKIIKIEYLDNPIKVGTLTIDQDEKYHNYHTFATEAGIYVKNSMLEDFWLPRRENGRGTEITTLPGGQNLGQIEDIIYFQKKLFNSLNVPVTRLEPEQGMGIGRATEVSRDEVKFAKFIRRMRAKFSQLFTKIIGKNLVLKGIMTVEEWETISQFINYIYAKDNYYDELKNAEVLNNRLQLLNAIQPFSGIYFDSMYIKKNVLRQDDAEIEAIEEGIMNDLEDPIIQQGKIQLAGGLGPMDPMAAQPTQQGGGQSKPKAKKE